MSLKEGKWTMTQAYVMTNTRTGVVRPYYAINVSMNETRKERNTEPLHEEHAEPFSSVLDRLMQRYNQELIIYARHILGTDDVVQDIVQETWMALYMQLQRQPPNWAAHANIPAWLWTVVRNKAINYRKVRQRVISLDSEASTIINEPRVSSFDYPENTAIREDLHRTLYQAIKSLREPIREVIAYRFFYGYSLHEIVQTLDVPLNTVKARLASGKKQLHRLLLDGGIGSGDLDVCALKCA